MTSNMLPSLFLNLWLDMGRPDLLWQLGTLVICIAVARVLSLFLRTKLAAKDMRFQVVRLGVESFIGVLWPLLALVLVSAATPVLAHWQGVSLLKVAIPLLASFSLIRVAFYILRRVFARTGDAGGFVLLFEKVFATVVWLGVALYITGLWPDLVKYLEQNMLPLGRHKVSLLTILQAGASVALTLMLALWASALLEERLMRMNTMHSSLRVVMARTGKALFILLAVLLSLSLVGIDLTVLSVFGGALGVGIGLGLQKLVSSYVSGFVILFERSLAIGDLVTVDKYFGQVTQINTRYTVVRSMDGIETVVPNEMLVSGLVQNYSLSDRSLRLATRITVSYQTDVDQVLELLEQAAASVARVSAKPPPQALLLRFDADGFELEVGFWIADPENGRSNVISAVNRAIWKVLQTHRIDVPYPQREVRLVDVRISEQKKVSGAVQAVSAS